MGGRVDDGGFPSMVKEAEELNSTTACCNGT
jgi:hypothetical protein